MEVVAATSYDIRHPPSAIVDGDAKSFWSSTGLFPQEFVLRLPAKASLSKLRIRCANIKHLVVERCDGASAVNFSSYVEQDLPDIDGVQDVTVPTPGFPVTFLKVRITSAYVDFVFVYSVEAT
jgi:heat shock protein beta-11